MNGTNLLLDTNIVLYIFGGDAVLSTFLNEKQLYISFVTQLELLGYQGISKQEEEKITAFLDECIIIDINNGIKKKVIELKQKHKVKLPDSIIMTTSIYTGVPVITSDKQFRVVKELDLILYE